LWPDIDNRVRKPRLTAIEGRTLEPSVAICHNAPAMPVAVAMACRMESLTVVLVRNR
jgi:hypothetical protein